MYEDRQIRYIGNNRVRFEINFRLNTPEKNDDLCQRQDVIVDLYRRIIEIMNTVGTCGSVAARVLSDNKGDVLIRVSDSGSGLPNTSFDQLFTALYRSVNEIIGFKVPVHTRMVVLHEGNVKVDLQLYTDSITALGLSISCTQKWAV